jgi:hypothetical protein
MQYFVTSLIWLSLETYYNQGMTSDQARSLIENLNDPYGPNAKLYCARAGYNGNWKVETSALSSEQIADVVDRIHRALELDLRNKRSAQPVIT